MNSMRFTAQQQHAIEVDTNLMIVAGPGSGKTSTMVAKAGRILEDTKRSLVMVTFTKEGAEELRRRLTRAQTGAGKSPTAAHRLTVGTFHSLAGKHLFDHRPREKMLSPSQQDMLFQDAVKPFSNDAAHSKQLRIEFESYMYAIDRGSVRLSPEANAVIQRYSDKLKTSRATDLFTVMRNCALFADDGTIPLLRCTDMVVDEAQDTDELQKLWIFAHCRGGTRLTIVGDDDQSIYEWRQALGFSVMQDFMDKFDARRVELGENFRSHDEILSCASTLIGHNVKRMGKKLTAIRGAGGVICSYHTPASAQGEELAELIFRTPTLHKETAILARKNRSLDELEMALTERGVDYVRIGNSIWKNRAVVGYLGLMQSLLDGSPVGLLGSFEAVQLDDEIKTKLLERMGGQAHTFLDSRMPLKELGSKSEIDELQEMSKACAYWRSQLGSSDGSSVDEVVLDVAEWLSGKHKRQWGKDVVLRAAGILCKLQGSLSARLNFISRSRSNSGNANAVTLMTMHGSKGLEFETVHIIDANNPEDGSNVVNEEAERRLMYVAITRAKDRCVLWHSGNPHPAIRESGMQVLHELAKLELRLGEVT